MGKGAAEADSGAELMGRDFDGRKASGSKPAGLFVWREGIGPGDADFR
jgi:hypothetical protein